MNRYLKFPLLPHYFLAIETDNDRDLFLCRFTGLRKSLSRGWGASL